ncbi:hypothetical protein DMX10_27560 [Pseudomonas sp. 57B-090624]|nr:hypothetical protein DMX10_27560 [Pseudomonas sp. 57B-090624]GJN49220.1 hypothetical protein TUM20249_52060 [Pseudomonas tohonis]
MCCIRLRPTEMKSDLHPTQRSCGMHLQGRLQSPGGASPPVLWGEFTGSVCVSFVDSMKSLKSGAFRTILDSWSTRRMGFASLYTLLRKPPAAARPQW